MRLKDLFTVPVGQKVTEKHLRRVLLSSICSILLCMSCLVSTTWAWYIVDIENTENVINIGTPQIKVTLNGNGVGENETSVALGAGTNTLKFEHGNIPDSLDRRCILYVTLMFNGADSQCIVLGDQNNYGHMAEIEVPEGVDVSISWQVTWFKPDGVDIVNEIVFTVPDDEEPEDTEETEEEPTLDEEQEKPDEEGGTVPDDDGSNNENDDTVNGSNTANGAGDNITGNDQNSGVTGGDGEQQTPGDDEDGQEDEDDSQTEENEDIPVNSETPVENEGESDSLEPDADSTEEDE